MKTVRQTLRRCTMADLFEIIYVCCNSEKAAYRKMRNLCVYEDGGAYIFLDGSIWIGRN